MAKGKWIQKASDRMEKKGTKGLFTKKARAHGMTTAEFQRHVLSHKEDFSPTTRKEAGFRKAVT